MADPKDKWLQERLGVEEKNLTLKKDVDKAFDTGKQDAETKLLAAWKNHRDDFKDPHLLAAYDRGYQEGERFRKRVEARDKPSRRLEPQGPRRRDHQREPVT